MSEQGSRRYPRTFGGLIGSMIVLVVVVVPLVLVTHWWGDARRDQANDELGLSQGADWVGTVRTVQSAQGDTGVKIRVVYPRTLPTGWYANTEPGFQPGKHPVWTMNFAKGESSYVGLELGPGTPRSLAKKNIDANPKAGKPVTIDTAVGDSWTPWSDAGGDHGYSRKVGGSTLIVWGPKDADVRAFLGLLTTKPLR
ncbi:DUF4245 family protein [Nocardioides sp. DS6]|uniref:DUF4245 family protein n=1 Tax=Nocardioides eburneus TaxID=3231482 RepID=A0ABV3SXH0_9ACTN